MSAPRDVDTSASLLLRIRDPQDNDAWSAFVAVYSPLVRRYCVRKGLQAADAADVTQEVMGRVSKSIAAFEYAPERGRFRNWLGTLIAREIATHLARGSRRPAGTPFADEAAAPDRQWDEEFTAHVLAVALDRIRGEFEPATWAAFEATWVRREPPAAVAAALGSAVHAVYVNKSRVLKRLEAEVRTLADDLPVTPP